MYDKLNILKTIKTILEKENKDEVLIEEWVNKLYYSYKNENEIFNIIKVLRDKNIIEALLLIEKYIKENDDSNIIYHYCPIEAFYGIVESKKIWLTDSRYMNDKYEGTWIDKVAKETISSLNGEYNEEVLNNFHHHYNSMKNKKYYLACFSKESDKLSQWRGYADDGQGIAIGFSRDAIYLTHNFDFELSLMDVMYDKLKQISIIQNTMEAFRNPTDSDLAISLKELSIWYKNPSFEEERETRFVYTPENNMSKHSFENINDKKYYKLMSKNLSKKHYYRIRNHVNIPYYTYDLSCTLRGFTSELIPEIFLGPKNSMNRDELKDFLIDQGLCDTKIFESASSYR